MTIRIDQLNPTLNPERDHEFPAIRDGVSVKLRAEQVLALGNAGDPQALKDLSNVNPATGRAALELGTAAVQSDSRYLYPPGAVSINALDNGVLPITPAMGRYITLEDHGSDDYVIEGFGEDCPVGWVITLVIPRTIGDTGGSNNDLGNYVQFIHSTSGAGFDHEMIKVMDGSTAYRGYRAYPNATDAFGNAAALHEALTYQHMGGGRWVLREIPAPMVGENANGSVFRDAMGRQVARFYDGVATFVNSGRCAFVWSYPAAFTELANISYTYTTKLTDVNQTQLQFGVVFNRELGSADLQVYRVTSEFVSGDTVTLEGRAESLWKPLV